MIGQGAVLASPMAMAAVVASVVKGSAVLPRLLPDHEVEQEAPAEPLTAEEADRLRTMMRAVVERGSGSVLADVPGWTGDRQDRAPRSSATSRRCRPTPGWWPAAATSRSRSSSSGASRARETAGPVLEQFLAIRAPIDRPDGVRTFRPVDPASRPVRHRRTARVLVVDDTGRTLLFSDSDPGHPGLRWWITPGGGVEPGESDLEAAVRELAEETGLDVDPAAIRGPLARRHVRHGYTDVVVEQDEVFFGVTVPAFDVDDAGPHRGGAAHHDLAPLVDPRRAGRDHGDGVARRRCSTCGTGWTPAARPSISGRRRSRRSPSSRCRSVTVTDLLSTSCG